MFTNLETSDFKNAMSAHGDAEWSLLTIAALKKNDRNIAIGKVAEALQVFAMRLPMPDELLLVSLYTLALQRVDFYSIALELIQAAECADQSLVKLIAADSEDMQEDLMAA